MPEQNNATSSLAHTKWNCKYHIVFAPKYRRKVFYGEKREAIREILINAVCHRCLTDNSRVQVAIYDDRIEIRSPGGLPSGMSESEYLDGQISMLRNPSMSSSTFANSSQNPY